MSDIIIAEGEKEFIKDEMNGNDNGNDNTQVEPMVKKTKKPTLNSMLAMEKKESITDSWQKVNKTNKLIKLKTFADEYCIAHDLSEDEKEILLTFLKDAMDKKKLHRVKDVVYDKVTGIVKDIPGLHYMKNKKHFTLRFTNEKRVSTLKSLGPKRENKE